MKMPSRFLLSLITLVLCIAGLQISADTAGAGFVPPADRLSIAQPSYSGLWKGPDLSVEYRYSRDQSQIDLSGKVRFAYFWIGYTLLQYFRLSAVFLDENGRVLESDGLVTNRDSFESIPFHSKLKLPSNAVFMAWSYGGLAGGGGNGPTSFWFYPIY
ncbi:MAG: hypothetical protein ABSH41_18795 [Syntrophobacteraceae bacterium]|jgi:hypothetical protein